MSARQSPAPAGHFPIMPPPIPLRPDAILSPSSALRRTSPSTGASAADTNKLLLTRRAPSSSLFHEDNFSKFVILGGPLLLLVHYGLYCVVPLVYLAYYSPFLSGGQGSFGGGRAAGWMLQFVTQCVTAALMAVVTGHYRVRGGGKVGGGALAGGAALLLVLVVVLAGGEGAGLGG